MIPKGLTRLRSREIPDLRALARNPESSVEDRDSAL
jgi:hypothetical protein